MKLLDIFKKKKQSNTYQSFDDHAKRIIADFAANDFLGKAAQAGHAAKDAVKAKEFDKAWGLFHEQKSFYGQHANRCGFTARQLLALDSSVHEEIANILRIERKHHDAMTNIVYWVLAGAERPIKRHEQKFKAYFYRCKFENTTLEQATKQISEQKNLPEYTLAQSIVSSWIAGG